MTVVGMHFCMTWAVRASLFHSSKHSIYVSFPSIIKLITNYIPRTFHTKDMPKFETCILL